MTTHISTLEYLKDDNSGWKEINMKEIIDNKNYIITYNDNNSNITNDNVNKDQIRVLKTSMKFSDYIKTNSNNNIDVNIDNLFIKNLEYYNKQDNSWYKCSLLSKSTQSKFFFIKLNNNSEIFTSSDNLRITEFNSIDNDSFYKLSKIQFSYVNNDQLTNIKNSINNFTKEFNNNSNSNSNSNNNNEDLFLTKINKEDNDIISYNQEDYYYIYMFGYYKKVNRMNILFKSYLNKINIE